MTTGTSVKKTGRSQTTTMTGPTYQLAEFMNKNWDTLVGRTNVEVAQELGYRAANIVSMWRTGMTRVPLERLSDISRLMKVDFGVLLPMWYEQYVGDRPEGKMVLQDIIKRVMTRNEMSLVNAVRDAVAPLRDPSFTPEELSAVVAVLTDSGARDAALKVVSASPKKAATKRSPRSETPKGETGSDTANA